MKAWKRDLGYIRELGPDEPRFDEAVRRVWVHIQVLEGTLREIELMSGTKGGREKCETIVREALAEG